MKMSIYTENIEGYELDYEFARLKTGVKLINCTKYMTKTNLNSKQPLEVVVPLDILGTPVVSIGSRCFADLSCDKLVFQNGGKYHFVKESLAGAQAKEIVIPKDITVIPEKLFSNSKASKITFENPSVIKRVEKDAFKFTNIESFEWFPGIPVIPEGCFRKSNIRCITGTKRVCRIDRTAFCDAKLESFPEFECLTAICESAFSGICVKEVDFKNSYITLMEGAFSYCRELRKVEGTSHLSIRSRAFESVGIEEFVWPDNEKNVCYATFRNCSKLRKVSNLKVSTIEEEAFKSTPLQSISCMVNIIGRDAFDECKSLNSVILQPFETKYIEVRGYAFKNCYNLTKVCVDNAASSFWMNAVANCPDIEILFKNCTTLDFFTEPSIWLNDTGNECKIRIDASECDLIKLHTEWYRGDRTNLIGKDSSIVCNNIPGWETTSLEVITSYDTQCTVI